MDKKKILLIGGALLIGVIALGSRGTPGTIGGGGIGSAISGFTISQDPTKKEETIAGGGDVYYNINFPDAPEIVLPPPNFTPFTPPIGNGGYGGGGGRTSFSSISSVPPLTKKEQQIPRVGGGELEDWVGGR